MTGIEREFASHRLCRKEKRKKAFRSGYWEPLVMNPPGRPDWMRRSLAIRHLVAYPFPRIDDRFVYMNSPFSSSFNTPPVQRPLPLALSGFPGPS